MLIAEISQQVQERFVIRYKDVNSTQERRIIRHYVHKHPGNDRLLNGLKRKRGNYLKLMCLDIIQCKGPIGY